MKVKYTQDHTDEYGQFFPVGCVAEHSDAEGARRVLSGVCEEAPATAFSRQMPPGVLFSEECVPAPMPEPFQGQGKQRAAKA